jgi:hypothetical protein
MGGPIFNQPVEGLDDGTGYGVRGYSRIGGRGVVGETPNNIAVHGISRSSFGVYGLTWSGHGVAGSSNSGYGVLGESLSNYGVLGGSYHGYGMYGISERNHGVYGESRTFGVGVVGRSLYGDGVDGYGYTGYGVQGVSYYASGVYGHSDRADGVFGHSYYGSGVYGHSEEGYGIYATTGVGLAAYLKGDVTITGNIVKAGGAFKIDHPLDPANKYLCHSFVESPDMKNVYDGVVILDDKGEAEIELPDWFDALNKDFRYQLTAIGAPGPNLYIAEEISDKTTNYTSNNNKNSSFKIAGGTSGMKVSWQVTGIRKDPWANANRIEVEDDKSAEERGYYLHPDLYGQPEEKGISHLLFRKDKREEMVRAFNK